MDVFSEMAINYSMLFIEPNIDVCTSFFSISYPRDTEIAL